MNRRMKTCLLVLLLGLAMATVPLSGADTKAVEEKSPNLFQDAANHLPSVKKADAGLTDFLTDAEKKVLAQLQRTQVSTIRKVEQITFQHRRGISPQEKFNVVGLVAMGRDVKGFAQRGDLVWIVRFVTTINNGEVTDVYWISSTTGALRSVFEKK